MRKITEVLRLKYEAKLSHQQIAHACGHSKGVISKYVSLTQAKRLRWPLPPEVDEARLEALLFPTETKPGGLVMPDYFQVHQELKRKEVTLQLLWAEYVARHEQQAYRYSQYCHHYRQWQNKQRRSMRQLHRAGERLFIDYCGPKVDIVERSTGEIHPAQVFVAVLGASSYTYAEASRSHSPDWIASHQRAFRFFDGVPRNCWSRITSKQRPTRLTATARRSIPAMRRSPPTTKRPYKPKDKAKAEVAVQVVERWILARLRHRTFFSLSELNQAIAELLPSLNQPPFQGREESRQDLFEAIDRPALRPQPQNDYEYAEWRRAKPGIDYHIEIDKRCYSVPHALVGQTLEVHLSASTVEVVHKGKRVASHLRHGKERYVTLAEHMPKSHREHRQWSPGRFLNWAKEIGPATLQVIKQQLEDRPHPEHGYRSCLGLLNLSRRYDKGRLEQACERALFIRSTSYKSISSILKQGLDREPLHKEETAQDELPLHNNARDAGYYH